jgi:hypothetical protein
MLVAHHKVHLSSDLDLQTKAHLTKVLPSNVLKDLLQVIRVPHKAEVAHQEQDVDLPQTTTSSATHWQEAEVATELAHHKKIEACTKSTL